MDSMEAENEKKDIKQFFSQGDRLDAISMIICDEADMVVNEELHLGCGKSFKVAERIDNLYQSQLQALKKKVEGLREHGHTIYPDGPTKECLVKEEVLNIITNIEDKT